MAGYENPPYPGIVDYSDDPLLPPWYIPGWTAQDKINIQAPQTPFQWTELPQTLTRVEVTGNYCDGTGNPLGGYLTFEQSDDLLISDPTQTPTTYFRVPKREVGDIPISQTIAWNEEGSGKIYLIHGQLDVVLLATDNANVTINDPLTSSNPSEPISWVYHVREYLMRGLKYDIAVPSTTSPVDINSLIVAGTVEKNNDWNRGY